MLAERVSPRYAVIGPWVSLFEIYCQLRGMEQAMIDLVATPALVDAVPGLPPDLAAGNGAVSSSVVSSRFIAYLLGRKFKGQFSAPSWRAQVPFATIASVGSADVQAAVFQGGVREAIHVQPPHASLGGLLSAE